MTPAGIILPFAAVLALVFTVWRYWDGLSLEIRLLCTKPERRGRYTVKVLDGVVYTVGRGE